MANTASRLSANGSLTISGSFDEITRIVPNGLILYYDAGKSYSSGFGNIVYDLSSSNNQGIIAGSSTNSFGGATNPVYASANSGYFILNGNGGYVTSSTLYTTPLEFTIGVWFRTATTTRASKLIGFGNSQYQNSFAGGTTFDTSYDRHLILGADNRVHFGIYPNQVVSINSSSTYTDNVWHYAVGTFSGSQSAMRLYVDGVLLTSNTQFNSAQAYNGYWKIGTGSIGGWPSTSPGANYFLGDIGPAEVYSRALTAQEVLQNYNVDAVRFGRTATPYSVNKLTANTLFITNEFDEVTYNPIANVAINLFDFTQDFSNAYWNKRLTITSQNALAPDNSLTATLFTYNLQFALVQPQTVFTNTFGRTYTFSCYVKATTTYIALVTSTAFCNFNMSAGTADSPSVGTSKITKEANGFYRCSLTFTSNSTTEGFGIWLGGFNGSVWTGQTMTVWGPQVEVNSVVTPYQAKGASGLLQSNTAMKTTNTGNTFIKGSYDEYSKMSPITEGLIFNIDPGYDASYIGSGSTMYDTTQNKYIVNLTAGGSSPPYSSDFGGILKFTSTFGNNAWANTNFPARTITPTSNYTMSAWVKFNRSNIGLTEFQFYNPVTFATVSPQANTGFAYGSAGTILGTNYYGDYGLFWYSQIRTSGEKQLLVGFQNRVTPYAEASPQLAYTMNDSLIFFNWTHIVGVLNNAGNFAGFYVNGVLVNSTTASQIASGSFPYSISTVRICADNVSGGSGIPRNFDGDIGPMSIWNRALSASEIQQMYNSQRSRFGV